MTYRFRLPGYTGRRRRVSSPIRRLLVIAATLCVGAAQGQLAAVAPIREAQELRFRDFFRTPIGAAGLEASESLRQADGQRVRLVGYMVQQEVSTAGRFMLAPRPVQMSQHADGEADDLPPATVTVYLDPTQKHWAVPHARGLLAVSGRLAVGRLEETDGRVSWVRLQLDPEATRAMNAYELAVLQHNRQHAHPTQP